MIFLILGLGLLLRLINLNQSFWLDESIEALALKNNSLWQLVSKYSIGDFHPPLYHVILKLWSNFVGYSEVSLRIPSVIFSLVTFFFIYKIGQKLLSQKAGILAGLFWAINPLAIYYAQENRMYSLAAMAASAAVFFFITKKWLWYGFFLLLALYTDYLPYLLLPVFFLMATDKKKFVVNHLILLIFLLPLVPLLLLQLHVGLQVAKDVPLWSQVVGAFDPKAIPLTFVKFVIGRIAIENKLLYGLLAISIGSIYTFYLSRIRQKLLWPWLVVPIGLGFLISFKIPIYSYFRFLFVLPAFVLLLASSAGKSKLFATIVFAISLISLIAFDVNPTFWREDWRAATAYINSTPNSAVMMPSLAQEAPMVYYGAKIPIFDKDTLPVNFSFDRVYLIRYVVELFDPSDLCRIYLENHGYKQISQMSFNGILIWVYQK